MFRYTNKPPNPSRYQYLAMAASMRCYSHANEMLCNYQSISQICYLISYLLSLSIYSQSS